MSNFKVCVLIPDFPICTGANTQALNLALNLKKAGTPTFMVFSLNSAANDHRPCYDKAFEELLLSEDIDVYQKPQDLKGKFVCYKYYLKLLYNLRNEYQLVYINGFSKMLCRFILLFKLMGKKVVVKMTGLGINDPASLKENQEFTWLDFKLLSLADSFVGTSTSLCEAYSQSDLLPKSKLIQIPNGVDTNLFAPAPDEAAKLEMKKKLNLPLNDKIVTYVGSVRRRKGLDLLINGWEQVVKEYPDATLLIIGALCPLCPSIKNIDKEFIEMLRRKVGMYLIEEKEVIKLLLLSKSKYKIQVLGTKINIHEYLQATDVFVFLSRHEGMPNALMEAMSSSLPCITSSIGEISGDLITHDHIGITVPDHDVETLSKTVVALLNDTEKCVKLGQAARQKILDEYPIEKIANTHFTFYKQLLGFN